MKTKIFQHFNKEINRIPIDREAEFEAITQIFDAFEERTGQRIDDASMTLALRDGIRELSDKQIPLNDIVEATIADIQKDTPMESLAIKSYVGDEGECIKERLDYVKGYIPLSREEGDEHSQFYGEINGYSITDEQVFLTTEFILENLENHKSCILNNSLIAEYVSRAVALELQEKSPEEIETEFIDNGRGLPNNGTFLDVRIKGNSITNRLFGDGWLDGEFNYGLETATPYHARIAAHVEYMLNQGYADSLMEVGKNRLTKAPIGVLSIQEDREELLETLFPNADPTLSSQTEKAISALEGLEIDVRMDLLTNKINGIVPKDEVYWSFDEPPSIQNMEGLGPVLLAEVTDSKTIAKELLGANAKENGTLNQFLKAVEQGKIRNGISR